MRYLYAGVADTIRDVLSDVKGDNETENSTIERMLNAASAFVDQFTRRPPGFFLPIGYNSGTKQKIQIAIDLTGFVANATLRMSIQAAGLAGTPIAIDVAAVHGTDTATTIAAAFATAIGANATLAAFFNIANPSAGIVTLENKTAGVFDWTLNATVRAIGQGSGVSVMHSTPLATPPIVRRYRGTGKNFLQIGRHVAGSISIQNIDSTLYYENPENGWPYAVDVAGQPGAGYVGDGDDYRFENCNLFANNALYLVTARFGFAETPEDIRLATMLIAQNAWDRGKGILGQVSPTGFVIERDVPPPARAILEPWIKRQFEIN